MDIVVKLPDKDYSVILAKIMLACYGCEIIELPKGHGRLVDADEIDNNIYDLTRSMDLNYGQISEVVDTAPTIIEADRSEEE